MNINVSRLPSDTGVSGWNAILATAPSFPCLRKTQQTDWLIVGAGFTGLSAAIRLRQLHPQATITIVDACRIAEGPAGRSSGFMIDMPHDLTSDDYGSNVQQDKKHIRINQTAIHFAHELAKEHNFNPQAIQACGKINAAASDKGLALNAHFAKHLDALNSSYEMLDASQMQSITGSHYYKGGIFSPGTSMLQPALYLRELAQLASNQRITLFENTPVQSLRRQGDTWQIKTPNANMSAGHVILAVNGHVESFGFYTQRLMHIFTYASMTRELSAKETFELNGHANWSLTPADPLGTTVRKISGLGGHRIIVRNRATYNPSLQTNEATLQSVAATHRRSFALRFPQLKEVSMEYCWGGRLCLSKNGVSAFGQLDQGLYSACCQNGLGAAKGTAAGLLCAELASGTNNVLVNELLDEEAPSKLPPTAIAHAAASAIIKWGEYRAGPEL